MLSSNNQSEVTRKQNAVPTFSLKKLSIGLVSLAVGSIVFLGNSDVAYAEEAVVDEVSEVVEESPVDVPLEDTVVEPAEAVVESPAVVEVEEVETAVEESAAVEEEEAVVDDTVIDEITDIETIEDSVDNETVEDTVEAEAVEDSETPADEVKLSQDTVYVTDKAYFHFETTFENNVESADEIEITLGDKPLSEWQSFNFETYEFDGEPWFRVDNLFVNSTTNLVEGSISQSLPYGMNATDLRPFPRWNFEELMGTYELAVVHKPTGERHVTELKIGNYEGFHTYDELKPAIDNILDLAAEKEDRLFTYETLGQTNEGRDLHFVTVARDKEVLDRYLNETLKVAHENPEVLQLAIENGELEDYQVPIFINNIHPDESPGVDAQIELLEQLATLDEISFYSNDDTITIDISDLLDDFILLFSITMNPDGKEYNSRENANKMDINRDNAFQTQLETQIMAETVAKYNPLAFLDLHGFMNPLLIEPTTPPHEPNFEYDLLMGGVRNPETNMPIDPSAPGAINHAIAMGDAAIGNTNYDSYEIPLLDWVDGWDDAGLGYTAVFTLLGGSLGHTIEIPQQNRESMLAAVYTMLGSFDYLAKNKDELYLNQLEVFRRSIHNEDNRQVDSWLVNANLETVGRNRGEYDNYFPDYYFIPLDKANQENRLEAYNMVDYFLRNGVKVYQSNEAIDYDGVQYGSGTIVVPLTQVRRGLVNAALSTGNDESDWGGMYAELVLNFPELRGFDSIAVRDLEIKDSDLTEVVSPLERILDVVEIETTNAVFHASNNDALRLVNDLLDKGVKVSIVSERAGNVNPGDYVVSADDLTENLAQYFVEYTGLEEDLVVKPIVKPAIYVAPPEDNYANLTTATVFVLKQLGFTLVETISEANIIVDASGMLTKEDIGDLPYIALGSNALLSVIDNELYDLDVIMEVGYHEGLLHAIYDQDSIISGVYDEESIAYIASGSVLGEPRAEAEVFARVAERDDFFIEGWWPNHDEIANGGVLGFTDVVEGQPFTFLATDVTNKAHPEYLYRLLANAIYSALASSEEIAEYEVIETEPELPVDPELPVEPESPINPELPINPEQPVVPELPTEPAVPAESNESVDKPLVVVLGEEADDTVVDDSTEEALPVTATSAWALGLIGSTSLLAGVGIKRKED